MREVFVVMVSQSARGATYPFEAYWDEGPAEERAEDLQDPPDDEKPFHNAYVKQVPLVEGRGERDGDDDEEEEDGDP